jgi:hypothetical protein
MLTVRQQIFTTVLDVIQTRILIYTYGEILGAKPPAPPGCILCYLHQSRQQNINAYSLDCPCSRGALRRTGTTGGFAGTETTRQPLYTLGLELDNSYWL